LRRDGFPVDQHGVFQWGRLGWRHVVKLPAAPRSHDAFVSGC
jgi:hypothetical protein